ncbi:hypothetical protein [Pontibacter anaerobius]|uniref:STAS/SEC14 domain-containing protein n=1 Tax=Pontibacter anaerobius TaxID=2993940 RepID=A0ABT3RG08_9BACT|nr:hypothetical protein [Pontibacter anaerobius]MCX2740547.1 hypothetical protein [Pontibacter anaerobius]
MTTYSTDRNEIQNKLKTLVAKNKCYELLYLPQKNRLCLSIYGFWKSKSAVPAYLADLGKALTLVKPGFTLLFDLSTMITHPQSVMNLHIEAQMLLQEAGLKKGACVNSIDRIANLQAEAIFGQGYTSTRHFASYSEAEAWLEQ